MKTETAELVTLSYADMPATRIVESLEWARKLQRSDPTAQEREFAEQVAKDCEAELGRRGLRGFSREEYPCG